MDLKEFISQTLVQIVGGVKEAQPQVRELGGILNPAANGPVGKGEGPLFATIGHGHGVFLVNFDVSVSVTQAAGSNAGGRINVSIASLGIGGESSNEQAATNRLAFSVPLALPQDEETRARLERNEARFSTR